MAEWIANLLSSVILGLCSIAVGIYLDRRSRGPVLATQRQISSIQRRRYCWGMEDDFPAPDEYDNKMTRREASDILDAMLEKRHEDVDGVYYAEE